jgi:outer membrane PBP1 activator LpoA protein
MPALHRSSPNPRSRARRRAIAIAFALSVGFSALSAAQSPGASEQQPLPPAAADKAPGAAIALVLPLGSDTFGRAAGAVRAGFLAAAAAANVKPVVIGHGDDDVLTAFEAAKEGDARVIVGPLVRDDLRKLSAARLDLPPTIALNQLDDSSQLPSNVYTLALTLDSDARQLAQRARDAGATTVAVIASDSPLQQRFAAAFNAEWILAGGDAPVMYHFDRSADVLRLLRSELIKTRVDAALLAIDGADVALAKSYIKSTPTYTSNQVNENLSREARFDLDEVQFVDIPWLVDPDGAPYARLKRPDYASVTLDRLYALGIDAFRVAQAFVDGTPQRLEFDGATGRLSLDPSRQFMREGRLMVFRSGQVVSADTR